MQPKNNGDARQDAMRIADIFEKELSQNHQSLVRTEHLMEIVERIAKELSELAEAWEDIDPQRAERWRTQEAQVRTLSGEFAHLEELEAAEAETIIAKLKELAHRVPAS